MKPIASIPLIIDGVLDLERSLMRTIYWAEVPVRRPTPKRRELRAAMRAVIVEELQALYHREQFESLPERLEKLLRELDLREDAPGPLGSTSK